MEQEEIVVINLFIDEIQEGERITAHRNSLTVLKAPCKRGFVFSGWCNNPNPYLNNSKIYREKIYPYESITLYALWTSENSTDNISYYPSRQIGEEVELCAAINHHDDHRIIIPDIYCNCEVTKVDSRQFLIGETEIEELAIPSKVRHLDKGIFKYCRKLKKLTLPQMDIGILFDIKSEDERKITLEEIVILDGDTVKSSCFAHFTSLKKVKLSKNTKIIEDQAFLDCSSLQIVLGMEKVESIGKQAFSNCCSLSSVSLSLNLKFLDDEAFNNCLSIKSIIVGKKLILLGKKVFAGCASLERVDFQAHVNQFKENLFFDCRSLREITVPASVKLIEKSCFENCRSLQTLYFFDNLVYIDSRAFANCISLMTVRLGSLLKDIGKDAFLNCYRLIEIINNSKMALRLNSKMNGLIARYAKSLICDKAESKIEITEEGLYFYRSLKNSILFNIADTISSLTLPKTFRGQPYTVRSRSLLDKKLLRKADLSKIDNAETAELMMNCEALEEVKLPAGMTIIEDSMFENDRNLQEISFPCKLKTIGSRVFYNCQKLQRISLPKTVRLIGAYSFAYCHSLEKISLPSNIKTLAEGLFLGANGLTSVTVPAQLITVQSLAFCHCEQLQTLHLDGNVQIIEKDAFKETANLAYLSFAQKGYWKGANERNAVIRILVDDPESNAYFFKKYGNSRWYKA